jgi:hypothetical protein
MGHPDVWLHLGERASIARARSACAGWSRLARTDFQKEALRANHSARSLGEVETVQVGGERPPAVLERQLAGFGQVDPYIGRRLDKLGDEAREVLRAAAVVGPEFTVDVVAAISGVDENLCLVALERAAASRIAVEKGKERWRFIHALVRSTLYEELSLTRRGRRHREVAEMLEKGAEGLKSGLGRDPIALAHHWSRASGSDAPGRAFAWLEKAGDEAMARQAPDQAVVFYTDALDIATDVDQPVLGGLDRVKVVIALGRAQRFSGNAAYRATLFDAAELARRLKAPELMAEAALENNRGLYSVMGQEDSERVASVKAALVAVGDTDRTARAKLLAMLALESMWDGRYTYRRALSDEALSIARQLGDPATLFAVLIQRQNAIWDPDSLVERLENTAEAETLAEELADPVSRARAALQRLSPATESGNPALYRRCLKTVTELASEIGQPTYRWITLFSRSCHALLRGDDVEAEQLANKAQELGNTTGQPDAGSISYTLYPGIRWHQGRSGEVINVIARLASEAPSIAGFRAWLANMTLDSVPEHEPGDPLTEEMGDLLTEEMKGRGFDVHHEYTSLTGLCLWAEVAARVKNLPAAEILYEILVPYSKQVTFVGAFSAGAVGHYVGMLAAVLSHFDDADSYFDSALEIHKRIEAPFHTARTQLEWARMLLTRNGPGDLDTATQLLETARKLARLSGCALVEQRTKALLDRSPESGTASTGHVHRL